MCLGDITAQLAIEEKPFDWKRTLRLTCIGLLCQAPILYGGKRIIQKVMNWKHEAGDIIKTAVLANLTLTPVAYTSTIGLVGWSQNITVDQLKVKVWEEARTATYVHILVFFFIQSSLPPHTSSHKV